MDIRTFDNVLSDDLLQLVQIELNLFMFLLQTQVITPLMTFYLNTLTINLI